MSASVDVRTANLDRVLRAIRESDEIAYKEIEKAMRGVAASLRKAVRERIPDNPVSNWGAYTDARTGRDLAWFQSAVKGSVGYAKKGMGKRSRGLAYEVTIKHPAGAIWALMGSGQRVTTNQGAHLVQTINDRFPIEHWRGSGKQGPRGMVEAYYAAKDEGTDEQIAQKIATALERAAN